MNEQINTRLEMNNFDVLFLFNSENSILSFESMCVYWVGVGKRKDYWNRVYFN